jgi:para-aminobenzoate synthetase component 1
MRHGPLRHTLDRWVDPADAFVTLFAGQSDVAWLDCGPAATSGRSYIAAAARVVTTESLGSSMLGFLRDQLAANRLEWDGSESFGPGWIGWLGYETRHETMDGAPSDNASSAFLFADRVLEFDHEARTITLIALGESWAGDLDDWRHDTVAALVHPLSLAASRVVSRPTDATVATWRDSDGEYLAMIDDCKSAIARGDAYLLCLTTSVSVDTTIDPLDAYLALRQSSPSHHGGLVRIGETALLSASPERFLSVSPVGVIESRPIKGTRPRGETAEDDAALAEELRASEKERAENLMIVDLMRNDIGRVSRIGSIEVPSLLVVESYAQVHQLVSTVRGSLADGFDGMDAVVACFPAGSMTGTPKSSAVRILDDLERHPRGIYSGAFGYFGLDGRIDLAMVIRSIVMTPHRATIGTGGGITALSDPSEELAEVKLKAAVLLGVLGAD